tara:strand:- start:10273 stop:10623 length:351 start_codon:yes stop_codon:yes gene_type:complete
MTLDELLGRFSGPKEASAVAGLSRSAGYHWYSEGSRRILPAMSALLRMANREGLTDAELGSVIRDTEKVRKTIKRSKRRTPVRRREREIQAKEEFLQRAEKLQRLEEIKKEIYKRW